MKMRKMILTVAFAVAFAAMGLTGYYFGYLQPRLELPRRWLAEEKELFAKRKELVESKLGWEQLAKLDPTSAEFGDKSLELAKALKAGEVESRLVALKNLWRYEPVADLSVEDDLQLAGRVSAAVAGVERMGVKVDLPEFKQKTAETRRALEQFGRGEAELDRVSKAFGELRKAGWRWVSGAIKAPEVRSEISEIDKRLEEIDKLQSEYRY